MLGIATVVWGLAEASGPTFSVAYRAGEDCPTRAQFAMSECSLAETGCFTDEECPGGACGVVCI